MLLETKAIVLGRIPYNDSFAIAHLLTEEKGFVSYRIPLSKSKNRKADRLRRIMTPLTEVHIVAEHREKRALQKLLEATPHPVRIDTYTDPVKREICFFLAELLTTLLRHISIDRPIYRFISQSLDWLEQEKKGIANFHLAFMWQLLHMFGIIPHEASFRGHEGDYFSLRDVCFYPQRRDRDSLPPEEAQFLRHLCRIQYRNMHLYKLNNVERQYIIKKLLDFYHIHLTPIPSLASLQVLNLLYK